MYERLTVAIENGIATVALNRPQKFNALDIETFEELNLAGQSLAANKSVRAVVLHGEGANFCAGLDFAAMQSLAGDAEQFIAKALQPLEGSDANFFQSPAWVWKQMPVPVIAALHGVVFGGGLQIALGADVRIAAPGTQLSIMEIKWGLIPDMSATQTLRELVRMDVAKELTFTGRVVKADEALQLGLITRVDNDPLQAAQDMAAQIAGNSPHAIRAAKRLFDESWHDGVAAGLAREARMQGDLIGRPNQVEAVMANMGKRAPEFSDPE